MFRKAQRMHLVGIGGSGMSGIAEVLVNLGYPVSGSDLAINASTRRLKKLGATVHKGHAAGNVSDADVVVISSAVKEDNPEVIEARRLKIPVIPRAEMLAELMRLKYAVAVGGAHGKTTTTAMAAEVMTRGKLDPTVVIGGRVGKLRSGAKLGGGEMMVVEADESDGSFLKMKPTIAVVTNIDLEHLDHYAGLDAIREAFIAFLSRVPFYGVAIVCIDDEHVRAILPRVDRTVHTYGESEDADIRATDIEISGFSVSYTATAFGKQLGRVTLQLPGRHSVANSLAALAVGLEFDVPFRTIAAALKAFGGVDRRLQIRGEAYGATVIDDYGHHPTEIRATLEAIRAAFDGKLIVAFQPHRYSRTQALLQEFGGSFGLADVVLVTDIYPASERPVPGLDGSTVAAAIRRHGHDAVRYVADKQDLPERLRELIEPGAIVLTLGAGDIWRAGDTLVKKGGSRTSRRAGRANAGGGAR
jgi:UDP-N-acetylmuramate--alanine ligase